MVHIQVICFYKIMSFSDKQENSFSIPPNIISIIFHANLLQYIGLESTSFFRIRIQISLQHLRAHCKDYYMSNDKRTDKLPLTLTSSLSQVINPNQSMTATLPVSFYRITICPYRHNFFRLSSHQTWQVLKIILLLSDSWISTLNT